MKRFNEIVNSNGRTNFILKTEQVLQEAAPQEETLTEITLQTGPLLQEKQLTKRKL
jgi:hypothetical protein